MRNSMQKKRASLNDKLKGVLTDLSVDIFGYEKKVTKNILNQMEFISEKINLPKEKLSLQIFQKDNAIRAFLYYKNKPLYVIPVKELSHFFMDKGLASLESVKEKIELNLKKYIIEFTDENFLYPEGLCFWIHVKESANIQVEAYNNSEFFKEIPLISLIKYFK